MAAPEIPDPFEPPPAAPETAPRPPGPTAQWYTAGSQAAESTIKVKALIVTIMLFVTVAGILLALFLVPAGPVDPYIISIPIIEYEDNNLPPNPWAARDAELLCACFPADADNTGVNAQARQQFLQKLDDIRKLEERWKADKKEKFKPDRPFVLHVCALAATDKGTLYLLPTKAVPGDPSTWIKVDEILRAMEDCPAKNKLLILDLARPTANAFVGPLADDTAARLDDLLTKYKLKDGTDALPCAVLTACSPDELSLTMPDARVSAFAFYLAEGIRGAADGYDSSDERKKDGKVMLKELCDYITPRVKRWAMQTAGVPQTPKLYNRGHTTADFYLKLQPAPIEDPPSGVIAFDAIGTSNRWKDRDAAMAKPDAVRTAGGLLARWEAALVRAERLFAATAEPRYSNAAIASAERVWIKARDAIGQPSTIPPYRSWAGAANALAAIPQPDPIKALLAACNDYLLAAASQTLTKQDPKFDDKRDKFRQAAAAVGPEVAARAVWDWTKRAAAREDAPPTVFHVAALAVKDLFPSSEPFYTEAALLGAIDQAELNSRRFREPATTPIKIQLFRTEEAGSLALLHGPDGFAWAVDLMTAADKARQNAEAKLFDPAPRTAAEYEAVSKELDVAIALFDEAYTRMRAVAAARQVAADSLRVLSATAPAAADSDIARLEEEWTLLAGQTKELADLICQAPQTKSAVPTTAIVRQTDIIASRLKSFRDRWSPEQIKQRTEPGPNSPDGLRVLAADLTVPLPLEADRRKVWDIAQKTAAKLHQKTRVDQDQVENDSNARTRLVPGSAAARDPSRRAQVSVRLLELAGYSAAGELARQVDAARQARSAVTWEAVAASLRAAWTQKLQAQIAEHGRKGEWARADRAARVFPPGVWPDVAGAEAEKVAPVEMRRAEETAFRKWVSDHYVAYGMIRKAVLGATSSYNNAATQIGPPPGN